MSVIGINARLQSVAKETGQLPAWRSSARNPDARSSYQGSDAGSECAVGLIANNVVRLPQRPDATVFSDAIPLFYLGQNAAGFWVVRDAPGRCGGLFVLRSSATNFARRRSAPKGCAMMILNEPLELDVENQGSSAAAALDAIRKRTARHAPELLVFVAAAIAEARRLGSQIARAFAAEKNHRAVIERGLFHGR